MTELGAVNIRAQNSETDVAQRLVPAAIVSGAPANPTAQDLAVARFMGSGHRTQLRAILFFVFYYQLISALRSGPLLYFYRTGYACERESNDGPGDDDWSGSEFCGDKESVIGAAQRFASVFLLPLQLVVEVVATPILAAVADRRSYVSVIVVGVAFATIGNLLLAITAALLPDAADAYEEDGEGRIFLTRDGVKLIMPLGTLIAARIALGISGSAVTAPSGGVVISMAPPAAEEDRGPGGAAVSDATNPTGALRGRYLMMMLAIRGCGGGLGSGLALAVIRA